MTKKGDRKMKFKNKKEEFIYYASKCEKAKESKDEETYLVCLKKAKELLEEIEKEEK